MITPASTPIISKTKIGGSLPKVGLDYKIFPESIAESSGNEKLMELFGALSFFALLFTLLLGPMIGFLYCFVEIPSSRYFILAYVAYLYYDKNSAHTGWKTGRLSKAIRQAKIWDYFRGYFPAQLVKTHELDPSKKYVFAYHPHGVYAIALFCNIFFSRHFVTMFPGIDCYITTLPANFFFPIWRDFALMLGGGTCTAASIKERLRKGDPGHSMIIAIGGAEEFKHMSSGIIMLIPGCIDLIVKKRKGFCKIALSTGASLVPIIGFGENEIYTKVLAYEFLHKVFDYFFKSAAPLFVGRDYSPIPHRHPLVTVGNHIF